MHEMKLRSADKVVLKSYPINLYRDDECKIFISMFIQNCQRMCLLDALKDETIVDPSIVLAGKEEIIKVNKKHANLKKTSNVLRINQPIIVDGNELVVKADEDDLFTEYPF